MNCGIKSIDVLIVTYHPDYNSLKKIIDRMIFLKKEMEFIFSIKIWDNTENGCDFLRRFTHPEININIFNSNNIGFGNGVNKLVEHSKADFSLVLHQDAVPFEGAVQRAFTKVKQSDSRVAVWEFRHFPYEHPKTYCPVTGQTEWFSGAAFILRNSSFRLLGGFEPRIFMYGEDVDLSFRLRANGFSLCYMPDCLVDHPDFASEGMQKPARIKYDRINNLLLRARYGSPFDVLSGFSLYLIEIALQIWNKNNSQLFKSIMQLFKNFFYFRRTGTNLRKGNRWNFYRWKYCSHRLGAQFQSSYFYQQETDIKPLVTIIIRTRGRIGLLREAIKTALNQTHLALEIIVVDDDAQGSAKAVIDEVNNREGEHIIYLETGGGAGRSKAANIGLRKASGDLIGFLDDDDQLYSDHVETLVSVYLKNDKRVVYGFAEEVPTKILDGASGEYVESLPLNHYSQDFSRVLLWYKNYLPIQSVLFHRSLYEEMGGVDERLDQYEDWSLWIKYSTKTDFQCVHKTTSRYRVPLDRLFRRKRESKFIDAYRMASLTHTWQEYKISPEDFRKMVDEYLQRRAIIVLTRDNISRFINCARLLILRLLRHS